MGRQQRELERYLRTMKTLIQVGDSTEGNIYGRIPSQRIEIVLLQNPYSLDIGEVLEAKVLFDGAPLEGRAVMAFNKTASGRVTKVTVRTDENGMVGFTLDQEGVWLIRVVQLRSCADPIEDTCDGANWESFWASFTFNFG